MIDSQGFGHAVFCARHALLGTTSSSSSSIGSVATTAGDKDNKSTNCDGCTGGPNGDDGGSVGEDVGESFLLVLGDHLYRRGAGTTHACASQLIHAFLEHGEAGKPAIGLKVSRGGEKLVPRDIDAPNGVGFSCASLPFCCVCM